VLGAKHTADEHLLHFKQIPQSLGLVGKRQRFQCK